VYFSIPVIGGYFIMDWATSKAKDQLGFDDEEQGVVRDGTVLQRIREGNADAQGLEMQNNRLVDFLSKVRGQ
jgi:hypothetical protein